ncbi:MAG TPA: hypothetical protein VK953_05845, partial [Methylophilus sp.]|nr:hypothetical protein [Methylophilus sp.]
STAGASSAGFSPQAVKARANNAANNAERVIFISLVCMSKILCTAQFSMQEPAEWKNCISNLLKKECKCN